MKTSKENAFAEFYGDSFNTYKFDVKLVSSRSLSKELPEALKGALEIPEGEPWIDSPEKLMLFQFLDFVIYDLRPSSPLPLRNSSATYLTNSSNRPWDYELPINEVLENLCIIPVNFFNNLRKMGLLNIFKE